MNDEKLFCRCGGEGRIVQVDEGTLAIGHVNGGRAGHRFRLASGAPNDVSGTPSGRPSPADTAKGRGAREVPGSDPTDAIPVASNLRAIPAPASEAGLTPAAPRVGNAAGRRRSTRRRVSPASAA